MSVPPAVKHVIEHGLVWGGAARAARRRRVNDVIILAYHDIVPTGERTAGEAPLHLPQAAFAAQLDALVRTHDVVRLDDALAPRAGPGARPRAVITFDDAYRGALTAGVAELAARRLPATVFVPPGLLGDRVFWWDALASGPNGLVPDATRRRALDALGGSGDAILADASRGAMLRDIPPYARSATEDELHRAVDVAGITLGSHSWTHPNLASLAAGALADELARPLAWLRARFTGTLPYLTYPYGISSALVERASERAGYHGALCISGGWVSAHSDAFAIPRTDVPAGLSLAGFRLRVAGVLS